MRKFMTFEEWYQWEMKQRDNKKNWHYPTRIEYQTWAKGRPVDKGIPYQQDQPITLHDVYETCSIKFL